MADSASFSPAELRLQAFFHGQDQSNTDSTQDESCLPSLGKGGTKLRKRRLEFEIDIDFESGAPRTQFLLLINEGL